MKSIYRQQLIDGFNDCLFIERVENILGKEEKIALNA